MRKVLAGLVSVAALLICVPTASAHFPNYCGHGYISDGTLKEVFSKQYDEGLKHFHVYKSYVRVAGTGWVFQHQHTRVC